MDTNATITLAEYASSRKYVVVAWYSTAKPMGGETVIGHPDFDFAERFMNLVGAVNADGDWEWTGTGSPRDDRGNSVIKLKAYASFEYWRGVVRSKTTRR